MSGQKVLALRDGVCVPVRSIRTEDAAALQRLVGRSSNRSVELRFFGHMKATQEVAFAPLDNEVRVVLTLEYRLKERTPPLVDRFFVRRVLGDSLRRTLARFANERRAELS